MAAFDVVATVSVGDQPRGVAVQNGKVYVANNADSTVSVSDAATNTVISTVSVGANPRAIGGADGYVYAVNIGSGNVSVIDASTDTVTATITVGASPYGIAFLNGYVYVANYGSGSVSVINAATNTVDATVTVGGGPWGITAGNGYVYAANTFDGTVSVIDASTNTVATTVSVSISAANLRSAVFVDGFAYVAESAGDVHVIDSSTNTVTTTIDVSIWGLTHIDGLIYGNEYAANAVRVIDPATKSLLDNVISVGQQPASIASGNGYVYAAVGAFQSSPGFVDVIEAGPESASNGFFFAFT